MYAPKAGVLGGRGDLLYGRILPQHAPLLAMAAGNRSSRRFCLSPRPARSIARERRPWSDPIALLLKAGIAYLEGSTPLGLKCLHNPADRQRQGFRTKTS